MTAPLPPRVFDSHLHIIDPRFPLVPNQGYIPAPFTCSDYLARTTGLHVGGGVVVSGSFQADDQTYLRAALQTLGDAFVGVTQLPPTVTDAELQALNAAGVRALRFNLRRGGGTSSTALSTFVRRVHAVVGWHVELYVDGADLPDLFDHLKSLPKVVIDHLGLTRAGVPTLLRLVEQGASVKATGFGRLDFAPGPVLQAIARANPHALLFGTDLPSTRAPRPFRAHDLQLIAEVLTPDETAKALWENAVALYQPRG